MARWQLRANKEEEFTGTFELLPEGTYKFGVVDVEDKTSAKRNEYASLTVEVLDGEFAGSTLFHNVVKIEEGNPGHGMLVHFLHAVGLQYDGDLDFDTKDFIGLEFTGDVVQEKYPKKDGTEGTRSVIKRIIVAEEEPAQQEAALPPPPPASKPQPSTARTSAPPARTQARTATPSRTPAVSGGKPKRRF